MHSELVLNGKVKYRLVKLTFGPERKLELYIGIFTPTEGKGPFPAIISQSSEPPGGPTLPRSPCSGAEPGQGRGCADDGGAGAKTVDPAAAAAAAAVPGRGRGPITAGVDC